MTEPVKQAALRAPPPPHRTAAPRPSCGPLRRAARRSIGGQAVLEGVMMRGVSTWAVASASRRRSSSPRAAPIRRGAQGPDRVISEPLVSWTKRHRAAAPAGHPRRRGAGRVAQDRLHRARRSRRTRRSRGREGEQQEIGGARGPARSRSRCCSRVGLFFLLPAGLTNIFKDEIPNSLVFVVIEKLVRISIFLGYLWLISRMRTSSASSSTTAPSTRRSRATRPG